MIFLNPNSDWHAVANPVRAKAYLKRASCSWGLISVNHRYNPWDRQDALGAGRIRWPPIGRRPIVVVFLVELCMQLTARNGWAWACRRLV